MFTKAHHLMQVGLWDVPHLVADQPGLAARDPRFPKGTWEAQSAAEQGLAGAGGGGAASTVEGLHLVHRQGAQGPGERLGADSRRDLGSVRPQVAARATTSTPDWAAGLLWRERCLHGRFQAEWPFGWKDPFLHAL